MMVFGSSSMSLTTEMRLSVIIAHEVVHINKNLSPLYPFDKVRICTIFQSRDMIYVHRYLLFL